MSDIVKDIGARLSWPLVVGIAGGVLAALLSGILGGFGATPGGAALLVIVEVIIIAALTKTVKFDDLDVVDMILFFASISAFGTLIGMVWPMASAYILTLNNTLTVTGLTTAIFFAIVAERLLHFAGWKPK